jgi:preprotein translocase subunit SecA
VRNVFAGIFGSRNQRLLKGYSKYVKQINALEENVAALDSAAMPARTAELKAEVAAGKPLDAILPEAFALAREAARRALGMRHFDVQLMGGMALHEGKIAEMRTGEGKTLVATLPAYLNALSGKGVHIVTVNEYLASAMPSGWARLRIPGPDVGVICRARTCREARRLRRRHYLRHQQRIRLRLPARQHGLQPGAAVQRALSFAIVDEVDSILIDEARTPLIISGQAEDSTETYLRVNQLVPAAQAAERRGRPGRLHRRREVQAGLSHRGGPRAGRRA